MNITNSWIFRALSISNQYADINATEQDKRRIDIYFLQEFVIFISRSHAPGHRYIILIDEREKSFSGVF